MDYLQRVSNNPMTYKQAFVFEANPRFLELKENENRAFFQQEDNFFIKAETTQCIQQLLDLLGLKYIVAEQEAEAQCAYLEQQGVVDFIITEDSDVFLFGASQVVYNYQEYVRGKEPLKMVSMEDIIKKVGINRQELISLAYLLGCDYCEGVIGVGVVNAMEILATFNFEEMKKVLFPWGQMRDDLNRNEYSKEEKFLEFFDKHKNFKKHWIFPDNFGREEVRKAFLSPKVNVNFQDSLKSKSFQQEKFAEFLQKTFPHQNYNKLVLDFQKALEVLNRETLKKYFKKA